MIIETVYIIETTRPEQVAWLTDPANFDDLGGGTVGDDGLVFLTREQMDVLRDASDGCGDCGEHAGDLEWSNDHDGLLIWLPDGGGLSAVAMEKKPRASCAPRAADQPQQ